MSKLVEQVYRELLQQSKKDVDGCLDYRDCVGVRTWCVGIAVSEIADTAGKEEAIRLLTLQIKDDQIAELIGRRAALIEQRDKIIDHLIKRFIPFYKRKLKSIELGISKLESVADEVKSFRLDEAIWSLILELDKARSLDG